MCGPYAVHFDVLSILIIILFHGEEYISGTFTTAGAGHADVSLVHWRGQSVRVGARARNRVRLVSPAQAAAHLQRLHVRVCSTNIYSRGFSLDRWMSDMNECRLPPWLVQ